MSVRRPVPIVSNVARVRTRRAPEVGGWTAECLSPRLGENPQAVGSAEVMALRNLVWTLDAHWHARHQRETEG